MYSTCYSCPILMKLESCRQIFEKYLNIIFSENPSNWSRVLPWDGQMDSGTHMYQLVVAFRYSVNVTKMARLCLTCH